MSDPRKLKASIDWMTWVFGPGLPPYTADFTTADLTEAVLLANPTSMEVVTLLQPNLLTLIPTILTLK